jgi:xanthine dehydrogenase YagS FAD-binding subunit
MSMRQFRYERPSSVDEAVSLLSQNGTARPLGGGTDILTLMKANILAPDWLIDIKRVDGLPEAIEATPDGLVIGARSTLTDLETHELTGQLYPAISQAAGSAATPQLRNMATVGGNLLQRPRCWYFRNHRFHCWLKGGDQCPARDGENQLHALYAEGPCVAVHPSDLASSLTALDATIHLRGSRGERAIPISDFFAQPTDERRTETMVAPDELILSVNVPPLRDGARNTHVKAMDRKVWAFALVGVAVSIRMDGGKIADSRLVLSGVAPVPWRCRSAEEILNGSVPGDDVFSRTADAVVQRATPLARNAYKIPLADGLVRQALRRLVGNERRVA